MRGVCGKTSLDHVTNKDILQVCNIKEDIRGRIRTNVLRWFGHAEGMSTEVLTTRIYSSGIRRKKPKGFPLGEPVSVHNKIKTSKFHCHTLLNNVNFFSVV